MQLPGSLAWINNLMALPIVRESDWKWLSAAWFCIWFLIYLVSKNFSPFLFRSYKKLPKEDKSDWNSRVVSDIHAVWATLGAVLIMLDIPRYDWFAESPYAYFFYPSLIGYLAYDLLVVLAHRNLWDKGTMLHHSVGIMCFCVVMAAPIGQFIGNLWYITEASTPFVNQRWFFDKSGMKQSPLYVLNGFIMWLGFLLLRVGLSPVMVFYTLYQDWNRVNLRLGYTMTIGVTVLMTSMVITNAYWFYLISRGLFKAVKSLRGKRE